MNPLISRHFHHPLKELQRDFNQIFHRMWDDQGDFNSSNMNVLMPTLDIEETDNEFTIRAELPGIKQEDISLEMHQGILTIKGEKKIISSNSKEDKKTKNYYLRECSYGYFSRSIQLPRAVIENDVEAVFDNGILTITIPKIIEEQNKVQKIAISTSSSKA